MVRSDLTQVVGRSIMALHGCQQGADAEADSELGMGQMWGANTPLSLIILSYQSISNSSILGVPSDPNPTGRSVLLPEGGAHHEERKPQDDGAIEHRNLSRLKACSFAARRSGSKMGIK